MSWLDIGNIKLELPFREHTEKILFEQSLQPQPRDVVDTTSKFTPEDFANGNFIKSLQGVIPD